MIINSIKSKLLSLTILPVLITVIIISIITINLMSNNSKEMLSNFETVILHEKEELLKNEILTAATIIDGIIANESDINVIKRQAKQLLSQARFLNGSGYFFAYEKINSSYHFAFHGTKAKLNGKKTDINKPDIKGYAFRKALIDSGKDDNKFIEYYYKKPNSDKLIKKIAFSKYIPKLNWTLVTGIYVDDIDEKIAKIEQKTNESYNSLVYTLVGFTVIMLIALLLIVPYISTISIINPLLTFKDGLLNFLNFMNKQTNDAQIIQVTTKDEIGVLTQELNENIEKIKSNMKQDSLVLKNVSEVVDNVAKGDLSKQIEARTNDEIINQLTKALNLMIENLANLIAKDLEVLKHFQEKDFTKRVTTDCIGEFKELTNGVNNLGTEISKLLSSNLSNGQTLYSNSQTLNDNVEKLSSSSNNQAASLEETAASLEEITQTMRENTSRVSNLSSNARELTSAVNEGQELSKRTSTSMKNINQEVTSINEAISVIDQIAFQTNILSLNAAVEAATAGESGKGFAVVAGEVRNLASRSAEAAKEIKDLVESATVKAKEGEDISTQMYSGYEKLNTNIQHTSQIIADITTTSQEQMQGVEQINSAISSLDQATQENASIALKTKEIATQTASMSSNLVEETSTNKF